MHRLLLHSPRRHLAFAVQRYSTPGSSVFVVSSRWCSTTAAASPPSPSPTTPSTTTTPGKVKVHIKSQVEGKENTVEAPLGMTLMEVIRDVAKMDMEAACDGTCACSTCHVIFEEESYTKLLDKPCEDEMDMLDLAPAVTKTSRLSCQVHMTPELDSISVTIPDETDNQMRGVTPFRYSDTDSFLLIHSRIPRNRQCPSMSCVIIGVSGASGSGKTSLSRTILSELTDACPPDSIGVICEDFYYKDQSNIPETDRFNINYDHPNSLEHALLTRQLQELKAGTTVELPQYDYVHHTRAAHTITMTPKRVIIVEGILLLTDEALRQEMDCLIFVDAPLDICLIRRVKRDMVERGRTFDSIISQYLATVRPMYHQFIEPSKRWADIIVPSWKDNRVAIDILKAKLNHDLSQFEKARQALTDVANL